MNWVKKTALTLSLCLSVCALSFAQGDLRKAKKYIELQDFDAAITSLKNIINLAPENQEAIIALGDAYRLNNQLPEAHGAFSDALAIGELPAEASKTYGDVLVALNDYPGALEQYSLYGVEYAEASQVLIEKCSYAINHSSDEPRFEVKEEYINTSKRDFGSAFLGDDLVYLSNRTDMGKSKFNKHVNIELLKASKDSKGVLKYPKRIKSLTGQEFNIISINYNPTMGMVAVTKGGQYDNIHLTAEDKCTLYIGSFDGHGAIKDLKPYEFNKTDYSTGFASFSEDGMTMYFASDRVGGQGGFDLYMSKMVGGQWSAPINMGAEVNSKGNEITPTVVADVLIFASDYRPGFGGYDLFAAYQGPAGFVNPENLGTGINSTFDEYGMIYDPYANVGYMTSTRSQGRGLEDIYRVIAKEPFAQKSIKPIAKVDAKKATPKSYEILKGMAIDATSGAPIADIEVQASKDDDATIVTAKTNDKGMFSIPLVGGTYYNIKFKADDYLAASRTIRMEAARSMPLLKVEMESSQIMVKADEPMIQPVAMGATKVKKPTTAVAVKTKPSYKPTPQPVIAQPERPTASEPVPAATFAAPVVEKAYAIQLAAVSKNESPQRFANVKDLGSLYTLFDSKVYKVRCGLFSDREEAEAVLKRVKVRGYETAFIIEEKPSDSMDLVMMDFNAYTSTVTTTTTPALTTPPVPTASNYVASSLSNIYKVRLATYTNPKWFEQHKVEGPEFGYVEVLLNDGKSIYMLAGFDSLQAAKLAHKLAVQRGFKDAYVVRDENGKLSKVN